MMSQQFAFQMLKWVQCLYAGPKYISLLIHQTLSYKKSKYSGAQEQLLMAAFVGLREESL